MGRCIARFAAPALLAFCEGCEVQVDVASARVRSPELRPIVLITLDTTRRDHLGCYGYFRDTTPSIDAFAAEAVLFDRAVATAPMTLPSHVSMMTGLFVHQHGVIGNLPRGRPALEAQAKSTWVPSILASAGYETAAFVSALVVGPETGMAQGFDVFDVLQGPRRKGKDTTELALRWLGERTDRPFFLWVHLFDPHEPNTPEPPYAGMFTSDDIHPERLAADETKGGLCRMLFPDLLPALADNQDLELPTIDRERIRDLMNRYDADVRYMDDCVGRILAELKERAVLDRAIVAIVGDHGQSLGQHDWLTHGRITNENLFVPMIVRFPREMRPQPLAITGTVSTIDLFPMILGAIEHDAFDAFVQQCEGRDVLERGPREFAIAQGGLTGTGEPPTGAFALIDDRWRYEDSGESPPKLFDLSADPNAKHEVSAVNPESVAKCKATLSECLARRAQEIQRPSSTSKEHQRALKDLGYAGDE
jgi:arylsulfatase A-like enzyme